jgi:hypothetical protein
LAGGVVALGYYQGWFSVKVDKDKIKEDKEQFKEKFGETVDKIRGKTGTDRSNVETATGKVEKIEAADNRFLMTTIDNKNLTVYTGPSSKLRLNDREVKLEDLQADDEVKVAYEINEGQNLATSVTANRN